jgi:hypothetical protein
MHACAVSRDGGETWTAPTPTGILSGAAPRLLHLRDDRLLLTFGRRRPPFGLYACLSASHGADWSAPLRLRPGPDSNTGYSSSVELADGTILTANYASKRPAAAGTQWAAADGEGEQLSRPPDGTGSSVRVEDPTGITGTFWRPLPAATE